MTEEYLQQFYTPQDEDYYLLLNINQPQAYEPPAETADQALAMHLVVAANTAIADIRACTQVDLQNLTSEFEGIATALNMTCHKNIVAGDSFTKDGLMSAVQAAQPGPKDIIVFLYSGHGFRFDGQTERFPMVDMRKSLCIQSSDRPMSICVKSTI